ncbi:M20 family metallopeptidase [Alicyclobacillus macrosporangiidus]|uniref:M20 family metallopeptidase n=1 Tax=Alicyclobacillus macrosporangiidus TaxID=392015 RepID=UPI000496E234|nr:M20 family metallopeptidase [Alicyclobacillus macrosporangiidus]
MSTQIQDLPALVDSVKEDVVRWRRHLHMNPELSFQEEKTSQFVYDTLASFGAFELSRPTKTSVVARLIGSQPGPVLALRADMDALPITEENTFEFVSKNPGVMHACGHDGHTAMLLATAKVLAGLKDRIRGEVRFFFQHAEELFPGGAEEMVKAGVTDGVDAVVGAHLWASERVGRVLVKAGALMAAPDAFYITIKGKGGHAAHPNETVDPIVIGSQVVLNLQHIASRNVDPLDPIVVSVCQFHGGTAHNIIPNTVELVGTVRTLNPKLRERVPELMERIIRGVTSAHGADYEFRYEKGYRPVLNDEAVTSKVREALLEAFGDDLVQEATPTMGGEDFSAFQAAVPGTFFFIGAGNPDKGIVYPHHHPRFTIDEDALPVGVAAFVQIVAKFNGLA